MKTINEIQQKIDEDGNLIIVAENGYELYKRNYSKITFLSEKLKGKKAVLIDDEEEYKSLYENLGVNLDRKEKGDHS